MNLVLTTEEEKELRRGARLAAACNLLFYGSPYSVIWLADVCEFRQPFFVNASAEVIQVRPCRVGDV